MVFFYFSFLENVFSLESAFWEDGLDHKVLLNLVDLLTVDLLTVVQYVAHLLFDAAGHV